jgi:uncharacterized protein (DUF2147 family)
MRKTYAMIAAAAAYLAASGTAQAGELFGQWQRGDGNVRIRIATCGNALCATNTWVREGASDKLGEKIVFNVSPGADGWSGSAYDPQRKIKMSTRLTVSGNRMVSSGCVLGGVICRSVDWTRIQ